MIHRKKDIVLLLTGTVIPNSYTTLKLVEPEERKKQYISAINFYLANTDTRIVFCENSGTSLKEYFPHQVENLEFITFLSEEETPDLGKGFKEMQIIDECMKKSVFVKESTGIIKITGRLQVLNINKLVASVSEKLFSNLNLVQANIYQKNKMDSRCFFYTPDFWPVLKKKGGQVDNSYSFERALWDAIVEYQKIDDRKYSQFKMPLKIYGISGGLGISYKTDLKTMFFRRLKHFYSGIFTFK